MRAPYRNGSPLKIQHENLLPTYGKMHLIKPDRLIKTIKQPITKQLMNHRRLPSQHGTQSNSKEYESTVQKWESPENSARKLNSI